MLEIQLLGAPCVLWNNSLISIPRRQVRALLYRLAAEMEPISREHLCWLFWPESAQVEAHRNLSHLLTHLRHALPMEEMLICSDDMIYLAPEHIWSDSAGFQKLVNGQHGIRSLIEAERAVSMYHGPFLDSFSLDSSSEFEAWATMHRAILEKHFLAALVLLTENEIERRNYPSAISHLQQALTVDPFDENIHRRLMEVYAEAGNRVAAIREFDDYSDTLRREMDLEPLPETQQLIHDICIGNRESTSQLARTTSNGHTVHYMPNKH